MTPSPHILIRGETPLAVWLVERLSPSYTVTRVYNPDQKPDLIILALPNWAASAALQDLWYGFQESAPPILVLQNGVGTFQRTASLFQEKALAGAVTCHFSYDEFSNRVNVSLTGGFALQADAPELALNVLRATGRSVKLGDAQSILWSSVFWGIQANALSAILQVEPAEIYQNPKWFGYEVQQLTEALFVIDNLGVRLMPLPDVNVPRMAWAVRRLPRPLLAAYLATQPRPPALRDELAQQVGRSDAAYFNGAVAVHAHDLNHRAPVNHVLAMAVTDIAEGRQLWDAFKEKPELLDAMIRLAQ
ncbi:MAG: hypothetical protein K8I82_22360 [Anaerolineae bacterium]|nr:hypothetical protein [Anaerolineae bacterium]